VEELEAAPEGGNKPVSLESRTPLDERETVGHSRFDVFFGMRLSNTVMFAIVVAQAWTLGKNGTQSIHSAANAARALRPVAGALSSVLFAVGFIGTGFLAVPVLAASASVGIAGMFGKDCGFSRSVA
jgi:Mn2+/Fe2+ NRAMP family transporter